MLSFLFETVLNHGLKSDRVLAENLSNKSILITVMPLKKQWKMLFSQGSVHCFSYQNDATVDDKNIDLHIIATPKALIEMLLRGNRSALTLEGDVVLAQMLERCFQTFSEDNGRAFIENFFFDTFGESVVYPVMTLFEKSQKKIRSWCTTMQQKVTDSLQEETNCLPLSSEVVEFCDEVDELTLRVDRLEARFNSNAK